MSITQALSGLAEPGHTLHTIAAAVRRWWRAYSERRDRRATAAILARLSDPELKDIGLARAELESVVSDFGEDRPRAYDRYWRGRSA